MRQVWVHVQFESRPMETGGVQVTGMVTRGHVKGDEAVVLAGQGPPPVWEPHRPCAQSGALLPVARRSLGTKVPKAPDRAPPLLLLPFSPIHIQTTQITTPVKFTFTKGSWPRS